MWRLSELHVCYDGADTRSTVGVTRKEQVETHDRGSRLVILPGLWAPRHHRAAVATLTAFVGQVRPDGLVLLDAPASGPRQVVEAFAVVVAGFRAVYSGPIGARYDGGVRPPAALGVTVLTPLSPLCPGWTVAPHDAAVGRGRAAEYLRGPSGGVVRGDTGRLRLIGRAVPGVDGGPVQAWLVLECGTLAADPDAGTLGFGVLEHDGVVTTAYPVRIGADGSFTFHRRRHTSRPGACQRRANFDPLVLSES
jgi:hypothetical protein